MTCVITATAAQQSVLSLLPPSAFEAGKQTDEGNLLRTLAEGSGHPHLQHRMQWKQQKKKHGCQASLHLHSVTLGYLIHNLGPQFPHL